MTKRRCIVCMDSCVIRGRGAPARACPWALEDWHVLPPNPRAQRIDPASFFSPSQVEAAKATESDAAFFAVADAFFSEAGKVVSEGGDGRFFYNNRYGVKIERVSGQLTIILREVKW